MAKVEANRLKKGDKVFVWSMRPLPGQDGVKLPVYGADTPATVIGVSERRGRGGADTMVYVELENGQHGAFRVGNVSLTRVTWL